MSRKLAMGAVSIVVLLAGGVGAVGWFGSNQAVRPPWYEHRTPEQGLRPMSPDDDFFIWEGGYRDPRTDLGLDFEEIEVAATDGSTLRGWYVPSDPAASAGIIAVHGGGGDRREFLRQVPVFHEAGYPVVLFDCREQGTSDGSSRGISLGIRESQDVRSVVQWVRSQRGWERVAVIGTSQGGASVILAAAEDPGIDVVIAENPFISIHALIRDIGSLQAARPVPSWAAGAIATTAKWRMGGLGSPDPIDVVAAIGPRPLLLMHGTRDGAIPVAHSQQLKLAAGDSAELWILEGGEHSALFNHAREEWAQRVGGFLSQALGAAR